MNSLAAPITRDTIKGAKIAMSMHLRMQGGGGWMQTFTDYPRLSVFQRNGTVTWSVDGKACRDIDAALAVLNGEKTLEDAVQQPPPAAKPKRAISLTSQIAEIDRELKQRSEVYPRIARSHPSQASTLDLQVEHLKAVRGTLEWLKENEEFVRYAVANRDAIKARMAPETKTEQSP